VNIPSRPSIWSAAAPAGIYHNLRAAVHSRKPVELQQYHWVLTQTSSGWRLAIMLHGTTQDDLLRHHGIVKALLPRQFVLGYVIVEQELCARLWVKLSTGGSIFLPPTPLLPTPSLPWRISSNFARTAWISCHINHLGLPVSREGSQQEGWVENRHT